ncbi:terminase small subunit [Erwinia rhapontici]|uniref:terminase small subunit n=1 Tax=Erwinia rhapontici TaxID=55212 RepID=UPI003BA0DA03
MAFTNKQDFFCREYLIDLNATQAAIRAGYSDNTAREIDTENLSKPDILNRIAELIADRNSRLQPPASFSIKKTGLLTDRKWPLLNPCYKSIEGSLRYLRT